MNRQIYKMTIADASDSITFYLLEVPIVEEDVGGTATNTTIDGNVYTDYMWLKKQWKQKWSIMCKDEYTKLHDIFERQFTNAEVPNLKIFYGDDIHTDGNAEGKSFQITNDSEAYDGEILDFSLYGNATQKTLSGKNLLNVPNGTTSRNNIELIANDGTIRVHNTGATSNGAYGIDTEIRNADYSSYLSWKNMTLDAGTYTLSATYLSGSTTTTGVASNFLRLRVASRPVGDTGLFNDNDAQVEITNSNGSETFTLTEKREVVIAVAEYGSNATIDITFKAQLEAGNQATPYEEYCGGIPSPNPDYPQEIKTVSGAQTVKITGKNIFAGGNADYTGGQAWQGYGNSTYTLADGAYTMPDRFGAIAFEYDNLTAGQQYTISFDVIASAQTDVRVGFNRYNNAPVVGEQYQFTATTQTQRINWTFTATEQNRIAFNSGTKAGTSVAFSNIMLNYGSTAEPYEPYQATSYEINLGGQNLCPNEFEQGGISATTGANNSDAAVRTTNYATVKENTTYTASTNKGTNIAIRYYKSDGTFIGSGTTASASGNTFTTPALTARVRFVITNTSDTSQNFMLNEGSTVLPYAPYTTYAYELAKIGNYTDGFRIIDGTWYIHKEVGKVASTDFSNSTAIAGGGMRYYTPSDYGGKSSPQEVLTMSSHFIGCSHADRAVALNTTYVNGNIGVSMDTTMTLNQFKTWFADNSVALYYVLATPTDTEIADSELAGQLDALLEVSLYKGLNNVFLIPSAGADGTMTMEYRIIYEKETIVQDTTPVKLDLTDGGIINACLCRQNVQVIMRETKGSSES